MVVEIHQHFFHTSQINLDKKIHHLSFILHLDFLRDRIFSNVFFLYQSFWFIVHSQYQKLFVCTSICSIPHELLSIRSIAGPLTKLSSTVIEAPSWPAQQKSWMTGFKIWGEVSPFNTNLFCQPSPILENEKQPNQT